MNKFACETFIISEDCKRKNQLSKCDITEDYYKYHRQSIQQTKSASKNWQNNTQLFVHIKIEKWSTYVHGL